MEFPIGAWKYSVAITDGKLFHEGRECIGATIEASREILISSVCPPRDRLRVLIRELTRAWTFATGSPDGPEAWMDLAATMFGATVSALNRQGSEAALVAMRPGDDIGPATARVGLSRNRECARCNGTVAGASVDCTPGAMPGVLDMGLYCEHCGKTQRWQEVATAMGLPSGIVTGKPRFEAGDTISEPTLST